jgi:hypothetical protein
MCYLISASQHSEEYKNTDYSSVDEWSRNKTAYVTTNFRRGTCKVVCDVEYISMNLTYNLCILLFIYSRGTKILLLLEVLRTEEIQMMFWNLGSWKKLFIRLSVKELLC